MNVMEQFDAKWVGSQEDELPDELRQRFGKFEPCEECGESKIAVSGEEFSAAYICYGCGLQYQMHEVEEAGLLSSILSPSDGGDPGLGKSREQAAKDGTRNFGKTLQMVGLLCCLTIIGAIIGIPLLIVGMHLEKKHD